MSSTQLENIDEVRDAIQQSFSREMVALERRRKRSYAHTWFAIFFGISLLAHIPVFFILDPKLRRICHQLICLSNLLFSYLAFFHFKGDDRLYVDYRKKIIPKLLKQINDDYRYYPHAKIYAKEFLSSGLYYSKLNKLTRKDLVLGLVNKAAFSLSFVKAQTREMFGKSGITGTTNSALITQFQGMHYVLKIPVQFSGKTIILPLDKTNFREVDEINASNLQSRRRNPKSKEIKTGNSAFDKHFATFTSLERETRQLLTEKRLRDIMEINALFQHTVAMSFFGSFVFIHVHTNRDIFGLDLSRPVDADQITASYLNLKIALKAIWILLR